MKPRHLIVFILIALYYATRYLYYGTLLPHSVYAKNLLAYYHSQPLNILMTWYRFALAAPLIAVAGIVIDRRLRWLGVYILLSVASCLAGPNSDWVRYTVHLFPLMLIAGIPALKRRSVAAIVCAVLLWQGYGSVQWMRYQAARLAPCQVIRCEMGDWLQANVAKEEWIISNDIGAIAYRAKDCRFIDLVGLTSPDILTAYRNGENSDGVIADKRPAYIADTFNIVDGNLVYNHALHNIALKYITGKQYSRDIMIAIAGVEGI